MKKSQQALFNALQPSLSRDRIAAYRLPGDSDGDVLARYLWNIRLSESLYPVLQALEVALRNSINTAFAQGSGRQDWYDSTRGQFCLDQRQRQEVADAKATLTKNRKPHRPGRVVAELRFGFWTSLFNVAYQTGGKRGTRLWPQLLPAVVPSMPRRKRTRATISMTLNDVRTLRNRVFHYEPIWSMIELQRQHAEILDLIGWMNEDLLATIVLIDRFPGVSANGLGQGRTALRQIMT
ncbi:MAG: hypothetical protein ACRDGS_10365 [Chloroflexota bacterium]